MAKYQKYAEYKDSGVEWLGEIPSHWNLYSLKRSVDKCTNGFWGAEPDGINDLCVLRVADFNRDNFLINENKLTFRSIQPKEAENRLLKKGDLLIEKSGGGDKTLVGCVVMFDKEFSAITSNFVAKMTPNINTDSKYLTYSFAHLYSGRVNFPSIKQTTGIQNLDSEAYLIEKFGFPPKNEQIQIANFLDHETAKIDSLIVKQEKLIELLKEKRQAVISHAVTKGLNPDVPMKDSGVEWLGQVPEHSVIGRLKNVLSIKNGRDYKNVEVEEGGYPVYGSGGIFKRSSDYLYDGVSILFGRKGTIDKPLLVNGKFWTVDTMFYSELIKNVDPEYIYFQSLGFPFDKLSTNTALPSMTQEDLLNLGFVIPPIKEQIEISKFIRQYLEKNRSLMEKAKQAIELMQERRTALISAAVTGKVDVRNWQNPNNNNEAKTEFSA